MATHALINRNFKRINGRDYIGSRDIDVGFHIDKTWTTSQLRKSDFNQTIELVERLGFHPISFRYVKSFDVETGKELSEEETKRLPLHETFQLFFDPIVDAVHQKMREVSGFNPIDEPLLALVFTKELYTFWNVAGIRVKVPEPNVLLGMKLNSVQIRNKEHKRVKDISDIYTLLWYTNQDLKILKKKLFELYPENEVREIIQTFRKEDIARVSDAIGVSETEIERVFAELR
jgi:hypothetical protein